MRHEACWQGKSNGDFVWDQPEERDGGKPGAGGFTEWAPFAPQVEVYTRTRGRCFHVRLSGGHASVFVLYNLGERWGEDILAHERFHVATHMRPAYDGFRQAALALGRPCMIRDKAEYIAAVILNQLKEEYVARSYRDATQYDWSVYGNRADPECRQDCWSRLTTWADRYAAARAATAAALLSTVVTARQKRTAGGNRPLT